MRVKYTIGRDDLMTGRGIRPTMNKPDKENIKVSSLKKAALILSEIYKKSAIKDSKK